MVNYVQPTIDKVESGYKMVQANDYTSYRKGNEMFRTSIANFMIIIILWYNVLT